MDLEVGGEWKREVDEKICDLFGGGEGTVRLEHLIPGQRCPDYACFKTHTKTMKML
jgi:hypothetical protein